MSPTTQSEVLTMNEVIKLLRISRATLYRRMDEGLIESIDKPTLAKKYPRRLFRRVDVERLAQPFQRAG